MQGFFTFHYHTFLNGVNCDPKWWYVKFPAWRYKVQRNTVRRNKGRCNTVRRNKGRYNMVWCRKGRRNKGRRNMVWCNKAQRNKVRLKIGQLRYKGIYVVAYKLLDMLHMRVYNHAHMHILIASLALLLI